MPDYEIKDFQFDYKAIFKYENNDFIEHYEHIKHLSISLFHYLLEKSISNKLIAKELLSFFNQNIKFEKENAQMCNSDVYKYHFLKQKEFINIYIKYLKDYL